MHKKIDEINRNAYKYQCLFHFEDQAVSFYNVIPMSYYKIKISPLNSKPRIHLTCNTIKDRILVVIPGPQLGGRVLALSSLMGWSGRYINVSSD